MNDVQDTIYKSYLLNPDIGYSSIINKVRKTDGLQNEKYTRHVIMNYDKKKINTLSEPFVGLYRSVVFFEKMDEGNIVSATLLCFSPPKSISIDEFMIRYPDFDDNVMTLTETVEGTMISLFYNYYLGEWDISTKGSVSGNYCFFEREHAHLLTVQNSTFRKMFIDALSYIPPVGMLVKDVSLENIPFIDSLSKQYCYNFVIQHPDNHIVNYHTLPRLILTTVYAINGDEWRAVNIPQSVYQEWECFHNSVVEFPEVYNANTYINSYDTIQSKFGTIFCKPWVLGATITHSHSGDRTCITNPVYAELKDLRRNNASMNYYFLCLKRMGKVQDFVTHFPSYKYIMDGFESQYCMVVANIHRCYTARYMLKNNSVIPLKYEMYINELHRNIFIPSIKNGYSKTKISLSVVYEYILLKEPRDILYLLWKEL
jgi:hypothetical protein